MSKKSQTNYLDETNLPKNLLDGIEKVCRDKKLSSKKKTKLIESVKEEYLKNSFESGEAIGIISAQSISEPATQMTMRTFHFAGSVGIQVTLGLPRLVEIFDARKKPKTPMMTLYLEEKYNTKKYSEEIAEEVIEKKMRDFVESVSLDLTNKRLKVKLKKLKRTKKNDILSKLKKRFKRYKIIIRKMTITIESMKNKKKLTIKGLQDLKKKVLDLCVSGIPKIKNTLVLKQDKDWVIKTFGSNFSKILKLDKIDPTRSYTNDIHEVVEVLGVEAARNAIIRETNSTMQQQGLDVDERHILLVADIMTFYGRVDAIGRYGVAGLKSPVLSRAAFEETIKHLIKASVRREEDNFEGIFDNVMINQQVPIGTGMFDLIARMGEE